MWGLHAAARPWKPIPWSSRHTVFVLTLMPVEARNPLAMDSAERWRLLHTMCLSSRWPRSVILRGLLLRGWVAVVPKYNITYSWPWNIQEGWNFTNCLIAKVESYHSTTILKRLDSSQREVTELFRTTHFVSQMFANGDCMVRCLILYTLGSGSDWNTWIQYVIGSAHVDVHWLTPTCELIES